MTRPLPNLRVMRLRGPDAISFLQGQVTQDLGRLIVGSTLLAALPTPQGRVVSLAWLVRRHDAIYALLPADLADALAVRLKRYLLRSKATIELLGERCAWIDSAAPVSADSAPAPDLAAVFELPDGRRVGLLPAGAPPESSVSFEHAVNDWNAADIAAGLPWIVASTSEAFIPQMLNLDRLDGISFAKGCYTGQEIVARTQHLGRIKRRSLRFRVETSAPIEPLAPLMAGNDRVGQVIASAVRDGARELLAVVSLDAADASLSTSDGRAAVRLPLPYALE